MMSDIYVVISLYEALTSVALRETESRYDHILYYSEIMTDEKSGFSYSIGIAKDNVKFTIIPRIFVGSNKDDVLDMIEAEDRMLRRNDIDSKIKRIDAKTINLVFMEVLLEYKDGGAASSINNPLKVLGSIIGVGIQSYIDVMNTFTKACERKDIYGIDMLYALNALEYEDEYVFKAKGEKLFHCNSGIIIDTKTIHAPNRDGEYDYSFNLDLSLTVLRSVKRDLVF